ncbi:TonB-dependent receptor [Mucilaginibacter glaciei]|uniref:TonB-dependent receptor n=1 Tax=Mucilaginibacter glaciei TaxID=2772109 RepID=A0A926S3G2_9SPHI|nr:TonB-dependent receptor [Mucilaginibacter glaciei]MBD1394209.1 TonB-dependent receptor [Mucilaginibacter glaciei]
MNKIYLILLLNLFCVLIGNQASAQSKYVSLSGNVKTSDGKPASFVSVALAGTNKGTMTDDNGYYLIANIKPGNYTLKVSFVGLKTQERQVNVTAGSKNQVDFSISENASQLNEVVITGSQTLNKPVALGKANIRPLDLPQSTGVISSTVIADQQAIRLGDVVKNVSGVSLTQTRGGVAETFSSRGYSIGVAGSGGSIFKNGIISNTQGFPDASTLESIEVLKGSSALLYGNVSGGVIINLVTKKPRFDWGGSVSMLVGSFNQYKPTVDLYGPISKNLAFRVVATHENADSYRDVVHVNRTYVNPSLLYKIGTKTDILLEGDYLKSNIVPDAGVGVPNNRITITEVPKQPRNRFIYPNWAYNNTEQGSGYLTINHRFTDNWKLTAIGGLQNTKVNGFGVGVPMTIAANGDWTRTLSAVKSAEKDYSAQINLNGAFKTGFLGHQLLFGTDFTRIVAQNNTFKYTSAAGVVGTAYDKINIFDPATFNVRTDIPAIADTALTTTPQNRMGIYAQDLISITSKFKVLAGLRWSYQKAYRTTIFNYDRQQERRGATADKSDNAFSPKLALIYQPVQTTSVYASYTNNFTINSGIDIFGNNLKPSIVNQYEAGVKNEFLNGRLSANLSVYRIRNSNFAQTALVDQNGNPNTNTNIKTLSGETTSDGLEVDLNGSLSKNFYFIAGYGYNYMRYTNTTGVAGSQVEGERLINNPSHTANGSIFYTFDGGSVKGLKIGASAFYTGKRFGGNNNTVGVAPGELNSTRTGVTTANPNGTGKTSSYNALLPLTGFTTVDLSAGYSFKHISLLTKVANIFDTFNYVVHDRYSLNPIPPRMFVATLAYKF